MCFARVRSVVAMETGGGGGFCCHGIHHHNPVYLFLEGFGILKVLVFGEEGWVKYRVTVAVGNQSHLCWLLWRQP